MDFFYDYHSADMPFLSMAKNHYHSDKIEIYYLEKGECGYFVEDKTYHVRAGDVVIIPRGAIHKTTYNAPYARRLITFGVNAMPKDLVEDYSSIIYVYRNYDIQNELKSIFKKIHNEYISHDKYSSHMMKILTEELWCLLLRNENRVDSDILSASFVAEAARYISENYAEEITLSSMAKLLSVSAEHLSRSFRKDTGFGFNEYLNLVRLKKADEILRSSSDMTVFEIALSCGFNDSNYFSDKFKNAYGVSPTKYRKIIEK